MCLGEQFPNLSIGKWGPINLSPQNTDLPPLQSVLWGHLREIVHSERIESLSDLCQKITVIISVVPVGLLSRVWNEVEFCFSIYGEGVLEVMSNNFL
jgi:hypothetical protein